MKRRSFALLFCLAPLFAAPRADAQAGIRVVEVERLRIDGAIRDWRGATFATVGTGADASMRFAIGHDDRGLYVAAEVWDERIVRRSEPGATEDAVILTLAEPGRRGRAVDIYLFAGVAGVSAGSAGTAPVGSNRVRALGSVQVVEGPIARGQGYTLEAFVPFSAVPGGARGWQSLRASVRLRDVDLEARPVIESEPAFVPVDPQNLDSLVPLAAQGGPSGALEAFLSSQSLLAARPTHELRADVAGDARPESVILVAGFVLVTGPGYRDGGYAYHRLPVEDARDVRSAELVDLTADRKAELVLVLRQRNEQGERDLWQVVDLHAESPRALFAIEIRKAVGDAFVDARVRVRRSGRAAPTIELRAGRAQGMDAGSYRESPAEDVEPILLPWGSVMERTYRWTGSDFERVGERANPRYRPPEPAREQPVTPAPAPPLAQAPASDALLAAFRRERGIAVGTRPRFRLRANLAGGPELETAEVYGRQLAIVGPGVQGGASWMFYEVPVPADADLLRVEALDVTGDDRTEIVLRVRQSLAEIEREVLIVHQLTNAGFPRLLQVEVARVSGTNSVRNEVEARGGRLVIRPGRARGWSEEAWPFAQGSNDSVAPLLLPWRDRAVQYELRGGRLVPR